MAVWPCRCVVPCDPCPFGALINWSFKKKTKRNCDNDNKNEGTRGGKCGGSCCVHLDAAVVEEAGGSRRGRYGGAGGGEGQE